MVGGLVAPPAELEEEAAASNSQGVIFVLENAKLETAKVGKVHVLQPKHLPCTAGEYVIQQICVVRDMHY